MDKLDRLVMKVSTWRRSDGKTYWRNPDTKEIEEYKSKGEKDVKPEDKDKDVDQPQDDQPEDQPQDKESQQLDKIRSGEMDKRIEDMYDEEEYDDAFKQEAMGFFIDVLSDEQGADLMEKHLDQIFDNPELREQISQQINDTVGEDITSGMDDAQFGEYVYDMMSDFDKADIIEAIINNMPEEEKQLWYDQYKETMADEEEKDIPPHQKKGGKVKKDAKSNWISNKIGILRNEGYAEDQAAAVAYSMYEEAHKSLDERIDNLYKKVVGE